MVYVMLEVGETEIIDYTSIPYYVSVISDPSSYNQYIQLTQVGVNKWTAKAIKAGSCVIGFEVDDGYNEPYTFTIHDAPEPPTPDSNIKIFDGTAWNSYKPYVWTGSTWRECKAYIYSNGWKEV